MSNKSNGLLVFVSFLKKIGILLGLLFVYRLVLFFFNFSLFEGVNILDFAVGTWFDIITLSLLLFPFIVLYFVPTPENWQKWKHAINSVLFILTGMFILAFNAWDIAYYSYTFKRISYDYLLFMLNSTETNALAGTFLVEFWWLLVLFLLSSGFLFWTERKIKSESFSIKKVQSWFYFPLVVALFIVLGRGGFQLKPIGILDATIYTTVEKSPIVLNSAFTVIKTIEFRGVQPKH